MAENWFIILYFFSCMSQKVELPSLTGHRTKTRKRDEKKVSVLSRVAQRRLSTTDQINMNVLFWDVVKSAASVRLLYSSLHEVTFYRVPETHCHVLLVTLYIAKRSEII